MAKLNWNLDQLKSDLSRRKEIKAWIITEEHTHRRERYFMSDGGHLATDQDRNIHSRNISVRLFVHLNKPGRQGEVTKKFFSSMPLKDQLDTAVQAALQTDHQSWELPTELPKNLPTLRTSDPRMAEDLNRVMDQLTTQIDLAVKKKRNTVFNSAELFLSVHNRSLSLSNGFNHRSSQSRIYTEAAYSFSKKDSQNKIRSDEYLTTQWAVSLDHLPIDHLFDEASDRAENSLDTEKPKTGKYSVIVDAEVLATLLHGHLTQLSAAHAYNSLPFIKPGQELIPHANGDLLTISIDPSLEYGAGTTAVSDQGLLQTPVKLVEQNQVLTTLTDKQYSDYLGIPPTTFRGNVVVDPGNLTHEELTQESPQVLEILQFSGLFADSNSGTFSSEIRLARLYDNKTKKVTYVKGGSLSGSISENFRGLRLSKSRVNRSHFSSDSAAQGYYGPEYALLSEVSIVG
jgi:predicted Zn-dependent protease